MHMRSDRQLTEIETLFVSLQRDWFNWLVNTDSFPKITHMCSSTSYFPQDPESSRLDYIYSPNKHQEYIMYFYVFILLIAFFTKAFPNPLPLDSVNSEPYLLATISNPFISDNLETSSFSSFQVDPIRNSQYASTTGPSEPVGSTDLAAVPCKIAFTGQNDNVEGICRVDAPGQQHKEGDEPERADPAVPNKLPQSNSQENICENTDYFEEHLCCDGPRGTPTLYWSKFCYSFVNFCLPCRS